MSERRPSIRLFFSLAFWLSPCGLLSTVAVGQAPDLGPLPGSPKRLAPSDAVRDAAGTGQLFESVHVPGFTDFREGLNGYAFADLDGNGFLDLITVTTPPFALDATWSGGDGDVVRTRNPTDRLGMLMNFGEFQFRSRSVMLTGSPATPDDFSQGWRGGQIPAIADFNGDGLHDLFVTRQCPMKGGRVTTGRSPVGCSLLLADQSFDRFRDVSDEYGALNKLAYNRSVSLGDVNQDGYLDIAIGADNVFNAFEGLPRSALFLFQPRDGGFDRGRFTDLGGTDLIPDFGGFYHDSQRDKAGPVISLRDIDNDGDLDLLQSYHVMLSPASRRLTRYSPGEYRHGVFNWKNMLSETGEFRFQKVTDNGLACEGRFRFNRETMRFEPDGESKAPALPYLFFADVDNDGDLDAIGFWMTQMSTESVACRFWTNDGDYQFREATKEYGLSVLNRSYNQWFSFFEAEADPRALADSVLRTGRSVGSIVGPGRLRQPPRYSDAVFADFDNDGWVDLVVVDRMENEAIETRSFLLMNRGDGSFEAKPTTFSGLDATGLSLEAVDLDNDGLQDLVVAADPDNSGETSAGHRYESIVYRNTGLHGGRENHWIRLRFEGAADAKVFGTRLEVYRAGANRLLGTRGIYNNASYRSSCPAEAHFGLGETEEVDIHVHPHAGNSFWMKSVKADRYLEISLENESVRPVEFPLAGSSVLRPETDRKDSNASASVDRVDGFTWLREETFSCGGQTHTVQIYRCDLFANALGLRNTETSIACEFVWVPAGTFSMGSPKAEQDTMAASRPGRHPILNSSSPFYKRSVESPQHQVDVPGFLISRTEVTQRLWAQFAPLADLPKNPSYFQHAGVDAPVESVSFRDAIRWIQAIEHSHGLSLRLPTEAEWEYACRAGTTTPIYSGKMTIRGHCDCPELDEIAWYMGNCGVTYTGGVDSSRWIEKQYDHRRAGTHAVGRRRPNAFGLFDMIGNVMEWCQDHAHADYAEAPTDGSAWIGGRWISGSSINGPLSRHEPKRSNDDGASVPGRVRRGGSWRQLSYNTRSAMRSFRGPDFSDNNQGFRLAIDVTRSLESSSGRTESSPLSPRK